MHGLLPPAVFAIIVLLLGTEIYAVGCNMLIFTFGSKIIYLKEAN
jgi:xanthine/uracil permease